MKYVPFLKLKQYEILALGDLSVETREDIIPFFDVEYKAGMTKELLQDNLVKRKKQLVKHVDTFYIDNYDHQRGDYINYKDVLTIFSDLDIIPVVALDRDDTHIEAVEEFLNGLERPKRVAIRFSLDDIQSFSIIEDDIDELLGEIIDLSEILDIVIDLRTISEDNMPAYVARAVKFIQDFSNVYSYDHIIITAATNITMQTNTQKRIKRLECELWDNITAHLSPEENNLIFGDYTVVATEYVEPNNFAVLQMTAKVYYTYDHHYDGNRGGVLRTHPRRYEQYYDIAQYIISQPFFRGRGYSSGDKYIFDRGTRPRGVGIGTGNPSAWIRATVNSHITFITNQF